jgi:hypothetical protein
MWVDYEGCVNGANPTNAQLAASTHGAAGTWDNANNNGNLKADSAAQSPLAAMGNIGSLGLNYTSGSGAVAPQHGYDIWTLPSPVNALSIGFALRTADYSAIGFKNTEESHPFTLNSTSFGNMWRVADEEDPTNFFGGHHDLRLSPGNLNTEPADSIQVNDLTWYWVTMKYVRLGTVRLSVYNIVGGVVGSLVGAVTDTDNINFTCTDIWIGNAVNGGTIVSSMTEYIDNPIIDYTNANFPLLPAPLPAGPFGIATPGAPQIVRMSRTLVY